METTIDNKNPVDSLLLTVISLHLRLRVSMKSGRVHPEIAGAPAAGDWHLPASAKTPRSSSSSAQSCNYSIRIHKDLIHCAEDAQRHGARTRSRASVDRVRRCIYWSVLALVLFTAALTVVDSALYLTFRPNALHYSIVSLSVSGAGGPLSPVFGVAVRVENPSEKVSIYYCHGNSISVSYDGVSLARAPWPTLNQPIRNVTVIRTALTGSGLVLSSDTHQDLVAAHNRGAVQLRLDVNVPIELKLGAVTRWAVRVMDRLTADARIASQSCASRLTYIVVPILFRS